MTHEVPVITIITVCYNSVDTLEETILNVTNLPYKCIDYIIIDGGSTDGSVDIIRKYQHQLKYWISEKDNGIYDAMNKGWAHASDKSFIIFLGAGDKIIKFPDLKKLNQGDIIVGSVQIGDKYYYKPKIDFRLRIANTIHHQAILINKSVSSVPPFNLNYRTYSDFDFNQRILKDRRKFIIDDNFVSYALDGGISTKFNEQEMLKIVTSNFGIVYKFIARIYYFLRHEV